MAKPKKSVTKLENSSDKSVNILKTVESSISNDDKAATTTITAVAPFELVQPKLAKAFKDLAKNIKADGFRPGKAPKSVVEKQIPQIMVIDQAARDLIADLYLPLLQKHKVDGIGEPKLQINKLADGNPLEFSITLANAPSLKIANYKKILKESDNSTIDPEVTDKELEAAIEALRQQWTQQNAYQELLKSDPEAAKATDPRQISVETSDYPTVNDEWVKQLGPYESVADFKDKFKTNIKANKGLEELDKRRAERMGKIVEATEFSIPELLYRSELERTVELRKAEIKQAGLKFNDYLKALQQNEADFKSGMRDSAENRVKTQLVIAEIAQLEKLSIDQSILEAEVAHLKKTYPEADEQNIGAYVTSQLTTNEVLKFIAADNATAVTKAAKKTSKPTKAATKKPKSDKK